MTSSHGPEAEQPNDLRRCQCGWELPRELGVRVNLREDNPSTLYELKSIEVPFDCPKCGGRFRKVFEFPVAPEKVMKPLGSA